jgi:hypothetical protein
MKAITIFRVKSWENKYHIGFDEYHFLGFIGHKKGFTNRFFSSIIPFSNGKGAWHIFGFRFTKSPIYVSKNQQEINGWYTDDKKLVEKLRKG